MRDERSRRVQGAIAIVAVVVSAIGVVAWVAPRLEVPARFWLAPVSTVRVDDRELRVVEVDYASGLRGVDSLGGLDGALFVLPQVMSEGHGMGMRGTLIDLDVAFFDPDGRFVGRHTMAVCETQVCPAYRPTAPWQFAIEAPAGALAWIGEGSVLRR
jgi:uncharacterized membrane protein (UPF0127 family)